MNALSVTYLRRTLQVCKALTLSGLWETARRKDAYVVLVLTALMVFGAYSFTFFGVSGLEIFVKDMAFTCIGLFSTVLGVAVATRQIPEEVTRRTIYPVLARPVTRWQLLLGKFVSSWVTCVAVFLALAAVALGLMATLGLSVGPIFLQYLFLRVVAFFWLCGFCIFLSLTVSQGAATVLGLVAALGSGMFTRAFLLGYEGAASPILTVLYGLLPHYALFDISKKVVYGWKPVPGYTLAFLGLYGLAIGLFWLWAGWLRFRRQAV